VLPCIVLFGSRLCLIYRIEFTAERNIPHRISYHRMTAPYRTVVTNTANTNATYLQFMRVITVKSGGSLQESVSKIQRHERIVETFFFVTRKSTQTKLKIQFVLSSHTFILGPWSLAIYIINKRRITNVERLNRKGR
jgi:hypothetical protein